MNQSISHSVETGIRDTVLVEKLTLVPTFIVKTCIVQDFSRYKSTRDMTENILMTVVKLNKIFLVVKMLLFNINVIKADLNSTSSKIIIRIKKILYLIL